MTVDDFLPSFDRQPAEDVQMRLALAVKTCITAGELVRGIRDKGLTHTNKGALDVVTQADLASEKFIQHHLSNSFPDDTFYGEELQHDFSPESVWIIDPIDGTVNFASGSQYWCISLAWVRNGCCELGVIYAPDFGKLFVGVNGSGSFCNKVPLQLQELENSQQVVIGIGTSERVSFDGHLQTLSLLRQQGFEHRRFGSGALMLAEVAAGTLHGYFEPHMNSWDALAGLLMIQEAGGDHLEFLTTDDMIQTGNRVLASSKAVSEKLFSLLADIS